MNGLKCPNCGLVNMISATQCHRCQTSFAELPPTAQVSVPVDQTFQAQAFASQHTPNNFPQNNIPEDNELGRKTYFWYRVYLGVMALMYVAVFVVGGIVAYASQDQITMQEQENFILGIAYAIIAVPFAIIFAVGLFLPRKSWNWVVGIIYMAIGMTSCCFLPALIPLLIYWIKPETQAHFGRR